MIILLLVCLPAIDCFAQNSDGSSDRSIYILYNLGDLKKIPKTSILTEIQRNCKSVCFVFTDTAHYVTKAENIRRMPPQNDGYQPAKAKLLTIHGNIMYDFFYQSHLDTPYFGNDLYQHTVTTYLDIRFKDNYPMRVYFTSRFGNSNYLRNITNLNFQYSPQTFINTVKEKIKSYIKEPLDTGFLNSYILELTEKIKLLAGIKSWLSDPSVLQKLVEEKEAAYAKLHRKIPAVPSLAITPTAIKSEIQQTVELKGRSLFANLKSKKLSDSSDKSFDSTEKSILKKYHDEEKKVDTLKKQIARLQAKYEKAKDSVYAQRAKLFALINKAKNPAEIIESVKQSNIPDSVLPKGYKTLMAIKKLGAGTSVVSYSELSAKDITVTGLQAEYNPRLYYAVAGGIINYRFKDYLLPEHPGPKQYLGLVRFGIQPKDSTNLIFTFYCGRKVLYNFYTTDSTYQSTAPKPNFGLMGFTIEKKIKLNEHSFLTAEIAKSSLPYYHLTNNEKQYSSVVSFSKRSNEAYSLKINSLITATKTNIEAYFKHYGANFQSFTLISTSSAQNAFLFSAKQSLFHHQVSLFASIRKNDFIDPLLNQRYVSNTIFKSIQTTVAIKHLPVVSAGFFPVTQLIKLNNNTYSESLFYTLTANASYLYNRKHTTMNTTALWMRFYNKPIDSGFIYFNTNNYLVTHSIFVRNATFQTSFSLAQNSNYRLISAGENAQLKLLKWISLGAGIKYNKQNIINNPVIGYELNSNINITHVGAIQMRIEKSYIPGLNQQLVANNIGRITYYRSF